MSTNLEVYEIDLNSFSSASLKEGEAKEDINFMFKYRSYIINKVLAVFEGDKYKGLIAKHSYCKFTYLKGKEMNTLKEEDLEKLTTNKLINKRGVIT